MFLFYYFNREIVLLRESSSSSPHVSGCRMKENLYGELGPKGPTAAWRPCLLGVFKGVCCHVKVQQICLHRTWQSRRAFSSIQLLARHTVTPRSMSHEKYHRGERINSSRAGGTKGRFAKMRVNKITFYIHCKESECDD